MQPLIKLGGSISLPGRNEMADAAIWKLFPLYTTSLLPSTEFFAACDFQIALVAVKNCKHILDGAT